MEKRLSTETLREVQGILAHHSLSKKYSVDKLVKLARRRKVARIFSHFQHLK